MYTLPLSVVSDGSSFVWNIKEGLVKLDYDRMEQGLHVFDMASAMASVVVAPNLLYHRTGHAGLPSFPALFDHQLAVLTSCWWRLRGPQPASKALGWLGSLMLDLNQPELLFR